MSTIKERFPRAIESGKVFIASITRNNNSTKNQATIAFAQAITNEKATMNKVDAILQKVEFYGKSILVSPKTANIDALIDLGLFDDSMDKIEFSDSNVPFVNDIFQGEYNLQVSESLSPSYEGQDPKRNPSTGEIMKKNGQNIYRTTVLVEGTPVHSFIDHDRVESGTTRIMSRLALQDGQPD